MIEKATDVIFNMETKLLKAIVNLLEAGTKKDIDLAQWKLKKLKEMTGFKKLSYKIIKQDVNEAYKIANDVIMSRSLDAASIIDNSLAGNLPLNSDPRLKAIWSTYENKTRDEFQRLGALLLRKANDVYIDIIEQSTAEVLAGQTTLRDAIRQTSKKWLKNGFTPAKDALGRQWTTEGYSQMVIRSGVRNSVTDIQIERLNQYDHDLIEIDSHVGARPLCALYQGKVFSLNGKTEGYEKLSNTSYGEAAGLFGINCGHRMYPFIEGEKKTYNKIDKQVNKEVYEESQKQRYYERQIRAEKRDSEVYGNNNDKKIDYYGNKIDELGRTRRSDREEIY